MKKVIFLIFTIIYTFISISEIYAQQRDAYLQLLHPLTGKNWEGIMERFGEGAKRKVRWDIMWNGKAVKQVTEVEKINFITETYYYWDPDKQEISMFSLSNNGNYLQGHVKKENGRILMYGVATYPKAKVKFRNTFELTEDGKLIDRWFTFLDGEWKPGHVFELTEIKE